MTTEIAVANRLGIALATDSAVTISGGGRVKVFNTADKLFELSDRHSVAVMINGNMDCLGVPWELLVKNFCDKEGGRARPTIDRWGRDFLEYVQNNVEISETIIGGYVDDVAMREVRAIQGKVSDTVRSIVLKSTDMPKGLINSAKIEIRKVLSEVIEMRRKYLNDFAVAESLKSLSVDKVKEAYAPRIVEILTKQFTGLKLSSADVESLTGLVVQSLLCSLPSGHAAGVVVAGFGTDESYPAVYAVEVDGRVNGILKITDISSTTIATSEDGGQVTTFAQTDVVERLFKGADPEFVQKTAEFIERAVTQVAEEIEKATRRGRISKAKLAERKKLIADVARTVTEEYQINTVGTLRNSFSREFDRMVAMMPKQELIELAEALVSITAVERKATTDEGTVGGPVDVAFISKHEGLVWIKRKHYFERDLNPRYFWRKYGASPKETAV